MTSTIVTIFIIAFAVVAIASCTYIYLRNRTLDDIRGDVYQLFIKAEHRYVETGSGKQKMKWVIHKARGLLPEWLQIFITEEFLYKVVQAWFDAVKDLLDDGKINNHLKE
ncbi:MAG: hypothetical protein ACI4EX_01885 [Lachnospiraceae bacterium]